MKILIKYGRTFNSLITSRLQQKIKNDSKISGISKKPLSSSKLLKIWPSSTKRRCQGFMCHIACTMGGHAITIGSSRKWCFVLFWLFGFCFDFGISLMQLDIYGYCLQYNPDNSTKPLKKISVGRQTSLSFMLGFNYSDWTRKMTITNSSKYNFYWLISL